MFVTDTVDVIYPPDDWMAESIIDRLAMMINEQRPVQVSDALQSSDHAPRTAAYALGIRLQKLTSEKTTDPFSQLPSPGSNPWNSRDSLDGGMTGLARLRSGSTTSGPTLRRPMLTYTRNVPTIGSLGPFFHHLSLASYESVYASVGVDWAAVEEGLTSDMFEVPADAQ